MPSFQARLVVNYIRRMAPEQRRVALEDLLTEFPPDWLDDAIEIASAIRRERLGFEPLAPRRGP